MRMRLGIRVGSGLALALAARLAAADPVTFPLAYRTDGATADFSLTLDESEIRFKAEPAYVGRQVVRSQIYLSPDKKDYIGFASDQEARKLYLDLNRNLDLTDDPEGVFEAADRGWRREFNDITIPIDQDGRRRELALNLRISGERWGRYTVKSSWESDAVVLGGRTYRVAVVDDGDGVITSADSVFIEPVDLEAGDSQVELQAPETLVLDGHSYHLSFELRADGQTLDLTVEPRPAELTEVRLTGQGIQRLVMQDRKTSAVFFQPGEVIHVPAGRYHATVWVEVSEAGRTSLWKSRRVTFRVRGKDPVDWKVGGPIVSTLRHSMSGSQLVFHQATTGADGEAYTLAEASGVSFGKPKLRVTRAGQTIHVGEFEYG